MGPSCSNWDKTKLEINKICKKFKEMRSENSKRLKLPSINESKHSNLKPIERGNRRRNDSANEVNNPFYVPLDEDVTFPTSNFRILAYEP